MSLNATKCWKCRKVSITKTDAKPACPSHLLMTKWKCGCANEIDERDNSLNCYGYGIVFEMMMFLDICNRLWYECVCDNDLNAWYQNYRWEVIETLIASDVSRSTKKWSSAVWNGVVAFPLQTVHCLPHLPKIVSMGTG